MRKMFTKERGVFESLYSSDIDDYIEVEKTPTLFHIGQDYEKEPASKTICKLCRGSEFNVGQGSWYTAIRCTTCKWEVCIHNG